MDSFTDVFARIHGKFFPDNPTLGHFVIVSVGVVLVGLLLYFFSSWGADKYAGQKAETNVEKRLDAIERELGDLNAGSRLDVKFDATVTPGPESRRRTAIIAVLRNKYLLLNQDTSLPNNALPPLVWMNDQLGILKESWKLGAGSRIDNPLFEDVQP